MNIGVPWIPLGHPGKYPPLYHQKELFRTSTTKNQLKVIIYLFQQVRQQIYVYIKTQQPKNTILFVFGSFLAPFSVAGSLYGVLPNISFYHADSLMSISFLTKSQNKAIDGSPGIFNRCYSQISGIFYVCFSNPQTKGEKGVKFCLWLSHAISV